MIKNKSKKQCGPLGENEKLKLISLHEARVPAGELAAKFSISVRSVAAYVANAHR